MRSKASDLGISKEKGCTYYQLSKPQVEEICRLYKKGYTIRQIEEDINVSNSRVSGVLKNKGLSSPKRSHHDLVGEEMENKICNLYKDGNSVREVEEITGVSNTKVSEVVQQSGISRTISEAQQIKERKPFHKVDLTGHVVHSLWEKEVDIMLYNSSLLYEYEPERYSVPSGTYLPDFVVEDKIVIEVKGWMIEDYIRKANEFYESVHNMVFMVVGNKIKCDIHLSWENRDQLIYKLKEVL